MKLDVTFNHSDNNTLHACGITDERSKQIDAFFRNLIAESTGDVTKTKLMESIIGFANNTAEAMLMFAHLEINRNHNKEIHFIGAGKIPKELREVIDELKTHIDMSKSKGMSVDGNGEINLN